MIKDEVFLYRWRKTTWIAVIFFLWGCASAPAQLPNKTSDVNPPVDCRRTDTVDTPESDSRGEEIEEQEKYKEEDSSPEQSTSVIIESRKMLDAAIVRFYFDDVDGDAWCDNLRLKTFRNLVLRNNGYRTTSKIKPDTTIELRTTVELLSGQNGSDDLVDATERIVWAEREYTLIRQGLPRLKKEDDSCAGYTDAVWNRFAACVPFPP